MADSPAGHDFAPAKVNLYLHVRGRRADGYHLLDSLVVFPEIGDRLEVRRADRLTLAVDGPFAGALGDADEAGDNLVLRAAEQLGGGGAALRLTKTLPVASGIGGGSSDAAATLRLLSRHWDRALPGDRGLCLGADVPVCLDPGTRLMRGIGDEIAPGPAHPGFWMVLANPGVSVPTGAVFKALARRDGPPGPPPPETGFAATAELFDWLRCCRNDLEAPARALCPQIDAVLAQLAAAPVARMSGSGATCFALTATEPEARALAREVAAAHPAWWVRTAPVASHSPLA